MSKVFGWVIVFFGLLNLIACSSTPIISSDSYQRRSRSHLYELKQWQFQGRLALQAENDSWTANLDWQHQFDKDELKLSGPLGVGAVLINLDSKGIRVDTGNGKPEYSQDPDKFLYEKLGHFVPVSALKYWVLGLADPHLAVVDFDNGFQQAGWRVEFKQMQSSESELMPRKLLLTDGASKLKLIIKQWQIKKDNQ